MAQVKNLSNEVITTITAGNVYFDEVKTVADWEAPLLEMVHGKKVQIVVGEPEKKKGKK